MKARAKKAKRSPAAEKEYARTHWGERGRMRSIETTAADPKSGELVELGTLERIAYVTRKRGDKKLTEYVHEFEKPFPRLAYVKDQKRGGLVLVGGAYRITVRGIVG